MVTAEYVTILGQSLPVGGMCSICEVNIPTDTSDDPPLSWCDNCRWIVSAYGVVPIFHALDDVPSRRKNLLAWLEAYYGR